MLRALSVESGPCTGVHVFQVDERVVPAEHPDRNLTHLKESLVENAPLRPEQIHAMPVESFDLGAAATLHANEIGVVVGSPPVLDMIPLGLGSDGHTASLVLGDAVLDVTGDDVAMTTAYQGRRRMTLTYPILNRARRILWVVTGKGKMEMVSRLYKGDISIPAGRVHRNQAFLLADCEAVGQRASEYQ